MVNPSSYFVARKYAVAFLAVFGNKLRKDDMSKLEKFEDALRQKHTLLYLLGLPVIPDEKKKIILQQLTQQFELAVFDRLIFLLLEHKRLFLLPVIVRLVGKLYRRANHIIKFKILSYPRVSKSDLKELTEFLAQGTGCAIIYTDDEDKNLIAGLRMESTTYLWEYSIAQQIRNVRKRTIR